MTGQFWSFIVTMTFREIRTAIMRLARIPAFSLLVVVAVSTIRIAEAGGALALVATSERERDSAVTRASSSTVLSGGTESAGPLSARTLSLAISIDRDRAELLAYTLKERPFRRSGELPEPRPSGSGLEVSQIEITLLGPSGQTFVQRVDVRGLCLAHPSDAPAHILGDRILLHQDTFIVEVPEIPGFDRLEAAYYREGSGFAPRVSLGTLRLGPDRFTPAGRTIAYSDLVFAESSQAAGREGATPSPGKSPKVVPREEDATLTPGTVHWPEEFGDTDPYLIYGTDDIARRINIVIVPDGYTYAQKGTMLADALSLVNAFRAKTPYREHDPFINYILVFAYSTQSGTDQCDCSIVVDTAMNTRFPLQTASCGHSDNRCLYYGNGNGGPNCDPNVSSANIAAAELRAPAVDATLVMVNTPRYGGCGGNRAVYSAGHPAAKEIAIHELGHSIAGLADEYGYVLACGSFAGEVNTSGDSRYGAWPEWIADLGPPREGAEYYQSCLYRPFNNCVMKELNQPFCAVCNQRWALTFFGHPRVSPSAPIESAAPASPLTTQAGRPIDFSLATRLGILGASNSFTWRIQGPGYPSPTIVATGAPSHTRSFAPPGVYTLTSEVIGDTNFIKPERTGANRDVASWTITATVVPEVSDDSPHGLRVSKNGPGVDLLFEDTGSTNYNLYVSKTAGTGPFRVSSPAQGKRDCALTGAVPVGGGLLRVNGYDLDAGLAGDTSLLFLLVTADNGPATEGSMGMRTSPSAARTADSYCNR